MCTIKATLRKEHGKGASRRLRIANKFPAIIYGGKSNSILIELDHDPIMNLQVKSKFYNEVLTIVIDDQEIKVKIQSIQRHPFKLKFQHIDFIRY